MHERLLRIIEDNTGKEGLEVALRAKLESLVRDLSPYHANGILQGSVYAYYDPVRDGIRSRDALQRVLPLMGLESMKVPTKTVTGPFRRFTR